MIILSSCCILHILVENGRVHGVKGKKMIKTCEVSYCVCLQCFDTVGWQQEEHPTRKEN